MDRRAAATLTAAGYDATRHRAQPVVRRRLRPGPDLVLTMDDAEPRRRRRPLPTGSGSSATSTRSFPAATYPTRTTVGTHGFEEVLAMVERTVARPRRRPRRASSRGASAARDPPAAGRPTRRGPPRHGGGGHGPGRRRRHRDRHPAAPQRRHHRADEDAAARPRGLLHRRGRRPALAGRGRGRRRRPRARGARRRPRVPDHPVGRARQELRRRRHRLRPRAGRHPRRRRRPASGSTRDGFIGKLPLPNRPTDTWAEFYAVRRVLPYLKLARDRGAVEPTTTPPPSRP